MQTFKYFRSVCLFFYRNTIITSRYIAVITVLPLCYTGGNLNEMVTLKRQNSARQQCAHFERFFNHLATLHTLKNIISSFSSSSFFVSF